MKTNFKNSPTTQKVFIKFASRWWLFLQQNIYGRPVMPRSADPNQPRQQASRQSPRTISLQSPRQTRLNLRLTKHHSFSRRSRKCTCLVRLENIQFLGIFFCLKKYTFTMENFLTKKVIHTQYST